MSLKAVDVWTDERAIADATELMESAFPKAEQVPVSTLVEYLSKGGQPACFKAFYEGDTFCGFALWAWNDVMTYLGYLAVSPKIRSHGLGTQILNYVKADRHDEKMILEMESLSVEADNSEHRQRRNAFYERNGFHQSGIRASESGVVYDIMCINGEPTIDECRSIFEGMSIEAEVFEG